MSSLVRESNTDDGTSGAGATHGAHAAEAPVDAAPAAAGTAAGATAAAGASANGTSEILARESVVLTGSATTRDAAIDEAGRLLLARGAVDEGYIAAMHEREESVSTYMGSFLAIPHGTNAAKDHIRKSAVSVIRYPEGIDWNGKQVKFVVGVAGINNEHLHILSSIAKVFTNKEQVARLEAAGSVDEVLELFGKVNA
ncbi:PTS sugar transporter subunit IIA [Pseudarthrobacter sp. Fe7]|nr:PTS sugar transporter subunit IIA [Pseudarthrobacter sp. Fe7]